LLLKLTITIKTTFMFVLTRIIVSNKNYDIQFPLLLQMWCTTQKVILMKPRQSMFLVIEQNKTKILRTM